MEKSNRVIVRIIFVVLSFIIILTDNLKSQEYTYIGKDSIKIINSMMEYHLDFIKDKLKFEKPTFDQNKYRDYTLRQLYDSLSQLYIPFNTYAIGGDIRTGGGFNFMCWFLVDSTNIYTLWVFIPDSLYFEKKIKLKSDYPKRTINSKLLEYTDFGIIADISQNRLNDLNQIYMEDPGSLNDNEFFQEYLKLLKKKYGKSKKRKK